jgi:hypothetical protein
VIDNIYENVPVGDRLLTLEVKAHCDAIWLSTPRLQRRSVHVYILASLFDTEGVSWLLMKNVVDDLEASGRRLANALSAILTHNYDRHHNPEGLSFSTSDRFCVYVWLSRRADFLQDILKSSSAGEIAGCCRSWWLTAKQHRSKNGRRSCLDRMDWYHDLTPARLRGV